MNEPPSPRRVVVVDDQDTEPVDAERWAELAGEVLAAEAVDPGLEVTLSFVTADVIAELKRDHLDGDGSPTDVLAFPIDDVVVAGVPGLLGDVVVCLSVARDQAPANRGCRPTHDGSVDAEVALLIVHGLLHLLGHDHAEPDESAAMRAREEHHLMRWSAGVGADR